MPLSEQSYIPLVSDMLRLKYYVIVEMSSSLSSVIFSKAKSFLGRSQLITHPEGLLLKGVSQAIGSPILHIQNLAFVWWPSPKGIALSRLKSQG